MSKAFTKESDDVADEIVPVRSRISAGGKNYITRQGAERLGQALNDLLEQRRGLLKETDPDAKASLRRVEAEVQLLQETLDSALIAETPANPEKVGFGAFVGVRYPDGEEETFQIVGLDEAAPEKGRISSASPLGRALLNKRAGEVVEFHSPAGKRTLSVVRVGYGTK